MSARGLDNPRTSSKRTRSSRAWSWWYRLEFASVWSLAITSLPFFAMMAAGIVGDCEKITLVNENCERVSLWGLIVPCLLGAGCVSAAWDIGRSPQRYVDRRAAGWLKGECAELLVILAPPMSAAMVAGAVSFISAVLDGSAGCHRIALW